MREHDVDRLLAEIRSVLASNSSWGTLKHRILGCAKPERDLLISYIKHHRPGHPLQCEVGDRVHFKVNGVEFRGCWIPSGLHYHGYCRENGPIVGMEELDMANDTQPFTLEGWRDIIGRQGDQLIKSTRVAGFWMLETPVTQQQFRAVRKRNPSKSWIAEDAPVDSVAFELAYSFARRLNKLLPHPGINLWRLPKEEEWEYACKAGEATARYGPIDEIAWHAGNLGTVEDTSWYIGKEASYGVRHTQRVKQKKPNAWGLYDMLGNVNEICTAQGGFYPPVWRGGSFLSPDVEISSVWRQTRIAKKGHVRTGFRLVCTPLYGDVDMQQRIENDLSL